jgi:hypothetical protein
MRTIRTIAICTAVIASVAVVPVPSLAFDADGTYMVHGSGQTTCREWLIDSRIGDSGAWQLQQWVLGYLTAYNEFVRGPADIAEGMGADGVFAWIDTYCGASQADNLGQSVRAMISERLAALE